MHMCGFVHEMLKQSQLYLKERFIRMLKYKTLILLIKDKIQGNPLWDSMEGKHFLINMAKIVWPVLLVSLNRQEAWRAARCQAALNVCSDLTWVRMFGLQSRARSAVYWSVHGVLGHSLSPVCFLLPECRIRSTWKAGKCPPEAQKPSGRDVRHGLWVQLTARLLWKKNLVWH